LRTVEDTVPIANPGTLAVRGAISVLLTDATVGSVGALADETSMRFNLSVNDVVVPLEVRAHPSGTFTEYPAPAAVYAT